MRRKWRSGLIGWIGRKRVVEHRKLLPWQTTITHRNQAPIGQRVYPDDSPLSPRHDPPSVQFLTTDDFEELVREVMDLVNNDYRLSNRGITISSPWLRTEDIRRMVEDGEMLVAIEDEGEGDGGTIGVCVQVTIKPSNNENTATITDRDSTTSLPTTNSYPTPSK